MSQTPWEQNVSGDGEEKDRQQDAAAGAEETQRVLDEDMKKLQEERDALFDRLARTQADFRNAQRRMEQDKEQAIQFANASLIKSLIPVLDNLDRAVAVDPAKADATTILKGMQIVQDHLVKVLAQQGMEVVNPASGTPFDPTKHEALMHQPSDQYSEPTVVQALQKGYVMHGRTLRPAGVAVSP
jgi:molecular chaperone GrpE